MKLKPSQDSCSEFPVFVISVDPTRLERTRKELSKTDLTFIHLRGVSTKRVREDSRISFLGNIFCTEKILAVALAHINAASFFLTSSKAPFCLVLEDDIAVPQNAAITYAYVREQIVEPLKDEDWDFVRLHSIFGNFPWVAESPGEYVVSRPQPSTFLTGSTAAYLLSRQGAHKLQKHRIVYHLDVMMNSPGFNSFTGPQLFTTFDLRGGPRIGGQDLAFWMGQDVLQLGPLRLQGGSIFFISSLICLFIVFSHSQEGLASAALQQVCLAYAAGIFSSMSLLQNDMYYYRGSKVSFIFGLSFPLLVVAFCLYEASSSFARSVVLLGAYALFFHHLLRLALLDAWPDRRLRPNDENVGTSQ